jgi:hypothetical protein
MKRWLLCLNAVLLRTPFVPAFAQLAATKATFEKHTFGTRVDLVLVPVIVNDAKGNHVAALRYEGVIDYPLRTKEVRFAIRNNATGDIDPAILPVESH